MTHPHNHLPNEVACPFCDKRLDSTSDAEGQGRTPEEGDYSLCVQCAEVAVFTDTLDMRKPTPEEAAEIAADEFVQDARGKVLLSRLI